MIGCMVLSVSLTGTLFWKELSENQNILNLIGSLSILKVSDKITYEDSILIDKATETPNATKTSNKGKNSHENISEDSTILKKDRLFSKQEYVTENEPPNSVALAPPEPSGKVSIAADAGLPAGLHTISLKAIKKCNICLFIHI